MPNGSEASLQASTFAGAGEGLLRPAWSRALLLRRAGIVAGLVLLAGVLQLVDHKLSHWVLLGGVSLARLDWLPASRLFLFLREMGTFYTPLTLAVGLVLVGPVLGPLRRRLVASLTLLSVVILTGVLAEVAQRGIGKQRMEFAVLEQEGFQSLRTDLDRAWESSEAAARLDPRERIVLRNGLRQQLREELVSRYLVLRGPPPVHYRVWGGFTAGLDGFTSMPSSHAAAGFACFVLLAGLLPGLAPLCWILAIGCAVSRVFTMDHYLGDTVGGAALGAGVAWFAGPLLHWSWGAVLGAAGHSK